jgi:lactoylglutathione lyase
MRIEHITIWANNLERMRSFYVTYFNAVAGEKYPNTIKNFSAYFLSFMEGSQLELKKNPTINSPLKSECVPTGLVHFAISVGTKEKVEILTERIRTDAFTVIAEPRTTGDGYYESVILDSHWNQIEITI